METFISILLKIVSIVMLIVFILSIVLLIFTFRKPKKISILSISITIAISLITLVIFSSLTHYEPPLWTWFLMAIIGIAVGMFWARTTKVFTKGNQVMSQNSIWYLAVWGGVFAINQIITIVTNKPPDIAMALLILSTATVWGTNGDIIRRYFKIRSGGQPQIATQTAAARTAVPSSPPVKPAARQPVMAGTKAARTTAPATPAKPKAAQVASSADYCPKCGAPLRPDASFCMKCGGKL